MEFDIGARLRKVREDRGLSQRQLAARSGLTSSAVSLIEGNKTSPSVASLKSLLDALPMSLSEFFSGLEEDGPARYFYAATEFTELSPANPDAQVSLRQVGDASRHSIQMLREVYHPGGDTGPDMLRHAAEEAGIVISGVIEVTVGEQSRVLNPGDGYLFDSRLPHRFRNIGNTACVVVSACTPPTF